MSRISSYTARLESPLSLGNEAVIAYDGDPRLCTVSTAGQDLHAQLAALGAAGIEADRIFTDSLSGSARTDRPGLAETGAPLSRWSSAELATEAIKPWQHRSWIFPRDPDFQAKAARVLDLYARCWEGHPLGPDDYVISADEKSQLQALQRRHRGQPPGPGRTRRVEFEYRRGGTLAFFAAYDVHHARVLGQIAPKTGIEPFEKLVAEVMTTEPYASARRVFWVVDNGSSHNGARSVDRVQTTWPTATLVHLPIHASWLNQVEIYFSILQRKAISPNDFADLAELAEHILGFQDRYNATATPFDWTYSRDDLNAFLHRLDLNDTHPHAA